MVLKKFRETTEHIQAVLRFDEKFIFSFVFQNGDTDSCNYKSMTGRQYSVKRLSEKFNVVSMKETFRSSENVFIENEAFQELKDDDL